MTLYNEDEQRSVFGDAYQMCCGQCGPGLCDVDDMTGENTEGWGWQR